MSLGNLYLIPVPLSEDAERRSYTFFHYDIMSSIKEYIVENEKTARRFLKKVALNINQQELLIHDYGKHQRESINFAEVFKNIKAGHDIGLMSEAGCPGVADPGAQVVAEAHKRGIKVIPLVGPSSILLALMASGFNGQQFSFLGYLPIDKADRSKSVKDMEYNSSKNSSTMIFIETPFRNNQLLEVLLKTCKESTMLCVACNLTGEDEIVQSKSISEWKSVKLDLHKKPTIFLLNAE